VARRAGDGAGKPVPSELPVVERRRKAEEAALRLLATRERSAVELKQRLRLKGYDAETIEHVLDRMRQWRFQDDRRFAEAFAASSIKSRSLAGRVVQSELRRRGIDKELAAQASTISPEDERANARKLATKRWGQLAAYPLETRRRRVAGLLARRGYSYETASEVLAELSGDADPHPAGADRDEDEVQAERDD
jgi:regulatory protein